jgi:hypothetical protein
MAEYKLASEYNCLATLHLVRGWRADCLDCLEESHNMEKIVNELEFPACLPACLPCPPNAMSASTYKRTRADTTTRTRNHAANS